MNLYFGAYIYGISTKKGKCIYILEKLEMKYALLPVVQMFVKCTMSIKRTLSSPISNPLAKK